MVKQYKMYINGEWVESSSGRTIEVENPSNEEIIATVPAGTEQDTIYALETADQAQKEWRKLSPVTRAGYIHALAEELKKNKRQIAEILTSEQGKPLREAMGEVDGAALFLQYASEHARRIEGEILPSENENEQIWIQRVPYGVTAGIVAWNFPLALAARKLGNALVCGNSMIVKPPSVTPLAVLELAKLAQKVGIPAGVLNVITGSGSEVGRVLVRHPLTRLITLTGSTEAGKEIYRDAADRIKVLRLELGGKAPFIVMDDAEVDKAVKAAVISRFTNGGQVCTCNERMYIHESIYDEFMEKFIAEVQMLSVGDPMQDPDIGPKVSRGELEKLEQLVRDSVELGGNVAIGGKRLTEGQYAKGHWFEPTVIENAKHDMRVMKEEIFGPIVPVMKVSDLEQALQLANDSDYGLSAYLFSQNLKKVMSVIDELDFGEIYVNRPHGESVHAFHNGFKLSGLGGEDGKHGLEGYLQKKTMYINYS
ncbi:aldehyde dehydrogenase [Paenibacillus sp. oral taxon 786]|uniref:aldehyde dehydrogenase n=3 Tax=Paenibacillus TaxID=44249 RepID=UPI00031BA0DC|nr:aldehyde dehydrogenase [Paenibacillus sp. oral taxon 786]